MVEYMMVEYMLVIGSGCLGYLIPELFVAIGRGSVKFPSSFPNILSAFGCACIGAFVAFGS